MEKKATYLPSECKPLREGERDCGRVKVKEMKRLSGREQITLDCDY